MKKFFLSAGFLGSLQSRWPITNMSFCQTLKSRVNGIDEMFGDNTYGPDGRFAANGYEALRKFDSNRDGRITAADTVFSNLRFWSDTNANGVAEPHELFSPAQLLIAGIDLNYDSNYKEVDRYGNEIKMKSIVQTQDGRMHLIFDIWFRAIR